MKKRIVLLYCIAIIFVVLTGCNKKTLQIESLTNHKETIEESEYGKISMEFSLLDGEDIRSFTAKKGEKYTFDYEYLIMEGTVTLQFRDSKDNIISQIILSDEEYKTEMKRSEKESDGEVNLHLFGSNISIISNDDKIKIAIIGKDAKGKLELSW